VTNRKISNAQAGKTKSWSLKKCIENSGGDTYWEITLLRMRRFSRGG
jgi:hypothetical protein